MRLSLEQRRKVAEAKAIMATVRKEAKKARPKPVTPTAKGQRVVRERNPAFLAYLRRQPCEAAHMGGCDGPIEAAHVRYSDHAAGSVNPGLQRKNHDRHANPLCRAHHQHDQHLRAERFFWERLGKDAYATAAEHYARFTPTTNS
jgi:hypothetical protein